MRSNTAPLRIGTFYDFVQKFIDNNEETFGFRFVSF